MALEVIEHVADPQGFLASLAALTKPWGAVCLSTINRTPRSYAVAIVGAERVAGLLPAGTHDWEQFLTPGAAAGAGCRQPGCKGQRQLQDQV